MCIVVFSGGCARFTSPQAVLNFVESNRINPAFFGLFVGSSRISSVRVPFFTPFLNAVFILDLCRLDDAFGEEFQL